MKTTLEQLEALDALRKEGSVSKAADQLGKSQSTISYTLQELQDTLGLTLVEKDGRKTKLNHAGLLLSEQVEVLLRQHYDIENLAGQLKQGAAATLSIAVDTSFPKSILDATLKLFHSQQKNVRLSIKEQAMSGTNALLLNNAVDLCIGMTPPPGFLSDKLLDVEFILVCSPEHSLSNQKNVSYYELKRETQVLVADSGSMDVSFGWLSPNVKCSVSNLNEAYRLVKGGLGYGRLPVHMVAEDVQSNKLCKIDMIHGFSYTVSLYLTVGNKAQNNSVKLFSKILFDIVKKYQIKSC
ncbi:LysR family transcriptional regulator [Microbulbifer sp. ANSA003]|uniref:LysR family transcriptional regulator n=1 Tax=Microbulbifer sp. ANSA003 TaxID=3243360 RepID=UPI00404264AB